MLSAALAEGLSQRALAAALGKDASWVSRRLALLAQLSEPRAGGGAPGRALHLGGQPGVRAVGARQRRRCRGPARGPAQRALVHARVGHLVCPLRAGQPHCPRAHGGPSAAVHPGLADARTPRPRDDPETQWLAELERLRRQLQRLARTLPPLLDPRPPAATWEALRTAVAKTAQALERLRQPLQEGEHVVRTATPDDPRTARQGAERAPDQPHPGARAPARCAGCWRRGRRDPRAAGRQPRARPHSPRRCPRSTARPGGMWCGCRSCCVNAMARRSPTAP